MEKDQRVEPRIPLADSPAGPYLHQLAIDTERRIAILRTAAAIVAVTVGPIMAVSGMLTLVMPVWLYVALEVFLLIYAVTYMIWAPYKKYSLHKCALTVHMLDVCMTIVIILNNGGMGSPYWALMAVIALVYTIRFGYTKMEVIVGAVIFGGTIALTEILLPAPFSAIANVTIGIGTIIVVVVAVGRMIVRRGEEAIQRAFEAEQLTVTEMINAVQHEVNNPLTIASGNMELLQRKDIPADQSPYFDRIQLSLGRIGVAVKKLRQLDDGNPLDEDGISVPDGKGIEEGDDRETVGATDEATGEQGDGEGEVKADWPHEQESKKSSEV